MSLRRLAPPEMQPASFAFTAENVEWAKATIAKYPPGRQASAVISLLWRGQEQEGWVSHPMIESVAKMLSMPFIRVLEVATFYTMFNLEPVGTYLVQVCTTTPCWLRGSDAVVAACKKHIHPHAHTVSEDGKFSWMEVECLGACVNAPMLQIGKDFYEDIDGPITEQIISDLRGGKAVKPGPQNGRRTSSEPEGGLTSLTDPALYDGSVIGRYHKQVPEPAAADTDRGPPTQKPPGAAT
ncbi:MAG TPA: NADH-quinone oxidoreductase subunit NuoE [Rhizomicrobium sp.]|jgi:NADH-quinone oxidoreductase subunit E|nr:NADH-quinone oxidoreductase subunit NuoE [Rhizomicrobium sp.]